MEPQGERVRALVEQKLEASYCIKHFTAKTVRKGSEEQNCLTTSLALYQS